jgi:hypothetical protein
MRYQLAWDHELCRAVVGVFVRAGLGFLRARARHDGVADGRGGAVAVIQRFGGALNLNVHVHALVLDGVFAKDGSGVVGFHPGPRLTALDVAEVLATVEPGLRRLLARRGLGEGDDEGSAPDAWADEAPVLARLAAASVQGIVALGPRPERSGTSSCGCGCGVSESGPSVNFARPDRPNVSYDHRGSPATLVASSNDMYHSIHDAAPTNWPKAC